MNDPSLSGRTPQLHQKPVSVRDRCRRSTHTLGLTLSALLTVCARDAAARDTPRTVTLITGDRVVISADDANGVRIVPGSARQSVRFIVQHAPARPGASPHLHVIPEDAMPLIAANKVDRRLFDVTRLIADGYDDASRDSLPLIVTYPASSGSQRTLSATRVVPGASIGRSLPLLNGVSANAPKQRVHEVWASLAPAASTQARALVASAPIAKVWLDARLTPLLDHSVPQVGAPEAWARGYEGDGVVVAVLDTGVDETHPDLRDRVVVSENFSEDPDGDQVGHGTHVASILAGSGAAEGGRYRGVAPGVSLLSAKVCEGIWCNESTLLAGMHWAVVEQGARVVNVSIGGVDTPEIDPLEEAVNTLSAEHGALFVISAGNSGPWASTVESPGSAAAALTVGAVDRDDQVAEFSSRGFPLGERSIKPDLSAPGVEIVAARGVNAAYGTPGEAYTTLSGTSMAAPHVAGAAALLAQQHPDWSGAELKAALLGSAELLPGWSVRDQGAGRLDVVAALDVNVRAEPASLSLGIALWPHEDDEPITRTVTYQNLGAATELAFDLDVSGPDGVRAPAEMFTIVPATLTLPEGGSGSVKLTANTRVAAPDGIYGGRLIATDITGRSVATTLALEREVESYALTVRHIDRAGAQTAEFLTDLISVDDAAAPPIELPRVAEDVTLRLPRGHYALASQIWEADYAEPLTVFAVSDLELVGNHLLELDARVASPTRAIAPTPDAKSTHSYLAWGIPTANSRWDNLIWFGNGPPSYYAAMLTPSAPGLESKLVAQWLDSSVSPSALYTGVWTEQDKLIEGAVKAMKLRQAAVVHARYAAPSPSLLPVNEVSHGDHGGNLPNTWSQMIVPSLPYERTEYNYSDDARTRWVSELWMHDEEYVNSIIIGHMPFEYHAGQRYSTRWNEPPFSFAMPEEHELWPWAVREGDEIMLNVPFYGDSEGHPGFIVNEGTVALFRDGEPVQAQVLEPPNFFQVPRDRAQYRAELDFTQSLFELTTRARAVWTFESAHVPDGESARLPLLSVHFLPELDERGRAPRGEFCVPFTVEQYGNTRAPRVSEPRVEVSYDDGLTFQRARAERDGQGWKAFVDHPRGARYVSLRARASDRAGNAVEQTLIRAYGLRGR
jgi:subtilisin family serine protease